MYRCLNGVRATEDGSMGLCCILKIGKEDLKGLILRWWYPCASALSRHSEMIDAACKALGIKTVWDFYDETPDEVQGHLR